MAKRCRRSFSGILLVGDQLAEVLGRRPHRLLEEREQQLVLAGEVLVEAAQRLTRPLDDFLDGELLVGRALHELERRVEETLHPLLGPHGAGSNERATASSRQLLTASVADGSAAAFRGAMKRKRTWSAG